MYKEKINTNLLSTYFVRGIVLGSGGTKKIKWGSCSCGAYRLVDR